MNRISDYLYRKASINKIPLNGTFELSPVCNFSCKMCYIRRTKEQIIAEGKKIIEWTEWLELAKECKEAGMLYLLLTGGEPFLYPRFKELYIELSKMGFLISINTNGTLIDEETVEWLKKAPPSRINITLYGTSSETYEKVCGNKNGYEQTKKAIHLLKTAGITVVINASMIPDNAADLESIINFGKENQVFTRVSTYMFPPIRRELEEGDSRFTAMESAKMYLKKQNCLLEKEQFYTMLSDKLKMINHNSSMENEAWGMDGERMKCRAGRSTFWISWEGIMTACGMMEFPQRQYPFERPFKACWNELTDKVRTVRVLEECTTCEKKEICNPCAAMLYAETSDVNKKSSYLCEMTDCIIKDMQLILERRSYLE